MKSRRKHPRTSTQQDVDLYLYDRNNDSQLTGRVTALLLDLSKQGARLEFSQVLIDGKHLFYATLDSDAIFIAIVFPPTDDDPEKITTLLARPVWFDRNMEDSAMPFKMGVQFVNQAPPSILSHFIR
ncbi:MAG: PilZ domain-containing protein [Deltaproteobacteria bacterium]|nr:PilZ domain-containing protein [Deltaproteobacteria bacterium]